MARDDESERAAQNDWLASLALSSSLAAPAIAFTTGALYITGYGYRRALLGAFGSSAEAVALSFQDTLAASRPALFVTLVSLGLTLATWPIFKYLGSRLVPIRIKQKLDQPVPYVNIGSALAPWIIMLGIATYGGTFLGAKHAKGLKRSVEASCSKDCFVYKTKDGGAVGLIVAEDARRVIIYAVGDGLILIPSSELKSIEPYYPAEDGKATALQLFPSPPRRQPRLGE